MISEKKILFSNINEKIELAVANNLPTKWTESINAKNSSWPDVSTLAESFSKAHLQF